MDTELLSKIKIIHRHCNKIQAKTAEFIGVSHTTVWRWICEGLEPKGLSVRRILEAYDSLPKKKKRSKNWNK